MATSQGGVGDSPHAALGHANLLPPMGAINFTFKKIFGGPESEDILLSFLNAVLGLLPNLNIFYNS